MTSILPLFAEKVYFLVYSQRGLVKIWTEHQCLLHLQSETVGLDEVLRALDRALLIDSGRTDHPFEFRALVAIEETIEGLDCPGEGVLMPMSTPIVLPQDRLQARQPYR